MKTSPKFIVPLCLAIFVTGSLSTFASAQMLRNDPNRPTDKISADLGISEEIFITCFSDVRPEQNGKPSGAKQRMNKAILLPCLQKANASITNDKLDQVMDRYRPEGPNGR